MKRNRVATGSVNRIRTVHLISLGCPKNLVDTGIAAGEFAMDGFALTNDITEADVIWINTCAFLEAAREEAAEAIEESLKIAGRRKGAKVVVAGCLVRWDSRNGNYFRERYPGVSAWIGIDEVEDTSKIVARLFRGEQTGGDCDIACTAEWLQSADTPRLVVEAPHYAYLRISDGCDNCCSYCLIPSIRGHLRSRGVDDVLKEADNLVKMGIHELIVIAQDTGGYGRDFGQGGLLPELLAGFDRLDGDFLVRLMYLHPRSVTDRLLRAMDGCGHLIRHIEMPVQHVTDHMLTRMNRHITAVRQAEVIRALRASGFTMRTTLMTGFPGETEEDYAALKDVVLGQQFSRIGVFAYSSEPGTPASVMPDSVASDIACSRRDELMELQRGISSERNRRMIGKVVPVIADVVRGRTVTGRLFEDIPDIDGTVRVRSVPRGVKEGDIMKVKVESSEDYDINGEFAGFQKQY